jgi:hypothetical protein
MKEYRLRTISSPEFDWLPPHHRHPARRISFDYRPSSSAQSIFGRAEKLTSAELIASVPVTDGAQKGRMSDPLRYPYQPQALDLLTHPCVRKGILTAPHQSGKSSVGQYLIAYWATTDPSDVGVYYPERDPVRRKFRRALVPIFKHPNFRHLCTGVEDDLTADLIQLQTMSISAGWTSSLATLSSFSYGKIIIEEGEKTKENVAENEAAIKFLLEGRHRDYGPDGKEYWISTLAVPHGPVSKERAAAEVQFDFLPRCPSCGGEHQVDIKHLDYIVDARLFGGGKKVQRVRYRCPCCQVLWSDADRKAACEAGRLAAREQDWRDKSDKHEPYLHDPRPLIQYLNEVWPSSVALTIPALVLPTVPLHNIAEAVEAAKTDIAAKQNLFNHYLDLPFEGPGADRKPEDILKRSTGKPRLVLPPADEISYITAGVDIQHKSLYYAIVAYGWQYTREGEYCRPTSWLVAADQIITEHSTGTVIPLHHALAQIERMTMMDSSGAVERSTGIPYTIDSMIVDFRGKNRDGGDNSDALRAWAAQTAGSARRLLHWGEGYDMKGKIYKISYIPNPFNPRHHLLRHDTDRQALEKWVETGLMIHSHDQGALLVNQDLTSEQAAHLCAVELNRKTGRWQAIPGKRRDYRDCLRYATLGWHFLMDLAKERDPRCVLPPWMR